MQKFWYRCARDMGPDYIPCDKRVGTTRLLMYYCSLVHRSRHILLLTLLLASPACGPGLEPFPFRDAGPGDGGTPLTGCDGLPFKQVRFWRHQAADITLATDSSAIRTDVTFETASGLEAATAVDWADGVGDMSGLLVSRRANVGDVSHQVQALASLLRKVEGVFTSVTVRHPGHQGLNADGDPMISGTLIDLTVGRAAQLHWVRNKLYPLLLGGDQARFTGPPTLPQIVGQSFVLIGSTVLRRGRNQVIFTGGIIHHNDYDIRINKARIRAEDLGNGSAVARHARELSGRCTSLAATRDPVVDILWVIDEQEGAQGTRIGLHASVASMWKETRRLGLDFRMAVVGMGRHDDGGGSVMAGLCGDNTAGAGGEFFTPFSSDELPPKLQPCLLGPGDTHGPGTDNHGLTNMRQALVSLLPPESGSTVKLRPNATLVVILVSEGAPKLIKDALGGLGVLPPFSATQAAIIEDTISPFAALLRGQAGAETTVLFPGAVGLSRLSGAQLYTLTIHPGSGCSRDGRGTGFIELAQSLGGEVALTCYNSGGIGRVLVGLVQDVSRRLRKLPLAPGTISASLALSNGHTDGGISMARSRRAGFDFHAASTSVLLYRDTSATAPTVSPLRASYLSW